jgi:flagellar hook-basal body complex protein FliE
MYLNSYEFPKYICSKNKTTPPQKKKKKTNKQKKHDDFSQVLHEALIKPFLPGDGYI